MCRIYPGIHTWNEVKNIILQDCRLESTRQGMRERVMVKTKMYLSKSDEGLHVYKFTGKYELVVEQEIKAESKNKAFELYLKEGGLNYSRISENLTETSSRIETTYIDAMTPEMDIVYMGTVIPNEEEGYKDEVVLAKLEYGIGE